MGVNKSRTLPKKRKNVRYRKKRLFLFLFKYSLVRRRWAVQSRYISSRTNKLMTGKFLLSLRIFVAFMKG